MDTRRTCLALATALALAACSDEPAADAPDVAANAGAGGTTAGGSAGDAGATSRAGSGDAGGGSPSAGSGGAVGGTGGAAGGSTPSMGSDGLTQGLPACAQAPGSCPATSIGIWEPLLEAADFGPQAQLVDSGGRAVLVDVGDGSFRVVRLPDASDAAAADATYRVWEFPADQQQPIAISQARASATAPTPDNLVVLTCQAATTPCSLWTAEVTDDGPLDWQARALPASFAGRGLVLDDSGDGDLEPRVHCAFGNGLVCDDGSGLQAVIEPQSGLELHDVAFGVSWALAVGEQGRWFKREPALFTWQEQAPLGAATLDQVSIWGDGAVVLGEGRVQAALGNQEAFFECSPDVDLAALLLTAGLDGLAYAVTADGQILQHPPAAVAPAEPYCAYQALDVAGPVLAIATAPCGASLNARVLTAQRLFGTNVCITL